MTGLTVDIDRAAIARLQATLDRVADIVNALDYISSACPPSAVSAAVSAAEKRLVHNIENHIERAVK